MNSIGKYKILNRIGRGGTAVVYRAYDKVLNRDVALKILSQGIDVGDPEQKRMINEARLAASLSHPNIVSIYELGAIEGRACIVMEYLIGQDLGDLIQNQVEMTVERKVELLLEVAGALQYAHSRGIIHRDVKPSNIRVLKNGSIKLMDFGIAKLRDGAMGKVTQTGTVVGSPQYMSPEQIRGGKLSFASDIFAFGVVTYQLLTGSLPFSGNIPGVLFKIVYDEPKPFPTSGLTLYSPALQGFVFKCLHKNAEQRFPDFEQVIGCLTQLVDQGLLLAHRNDPVFEEPEIRPADDPPGAGTDFSSESLQAVAGRLVQTPASFPEAAAEPTPAQPLNELELTHTYHFRDPERRRSRANLSTYGLSLITALAAFVFATWWTAGDINRRPSLPDFAQVSDLNRSLTTLNPDHALLSTATPRVFAQPPASLPNPALEEPSPPVESPVLEATAPPAPPVSSDPPAPDPAQERQIQEAARLAADVRNRLQSLEARSLAAELPELPASRKALAAGETALARKDALEATSQFRAAILEIEKAQVRAETILSQQLEGARQQEQKTRQTRKQALTDEARQSFSDLVESAEAALAEAEQSLANSRPEAATARFRDAEEQFRALSGVSEAWKKAQTLEQQARYDEALELLAPLLQNPRTSISSVQKLNERLTASDQNLRTALAKALAALDAGTLPEAERELALLTGPEQSLSAVTDLRERIASRLQGDGQPPHLEVIELDYRAEQPFLLEVEAIDTSGIKEVVLHARCRQDDNFLATPMKLSGPNRYRATIGIDRHEGKQIRYYIVALDLAGNAVRIGSERKPEKAKSSVTFNITAPPG